VFDEVIYDLNIWICSKNKKQAELIFCFVLFLDNICFVAIPECILCLHQISLAVPQGQKSDS
jgi:hypothetical protein